MALSAAMLSSIVITDTTPAAAAPVALDQDGRWGPVEAWPMVAIHAALDANGRVVTYGTNGDGTQTGRFIYDIWTPGASAAGGHNTLTNTTRTDIFCSLQLNRSDTGDMLLFGGDNWTGAGTNNLGNPDITEISATTGAISQLPGMNRPRWYATGTTMPNGSILVQGGLGGEDFPERWTPTAGAELLDLDTSGMSWYYPRNFVIPDGRIFGIAADGWMYYVSEEMNTLDVVGRLPYAHRGVNATAVMFEPGKILFFGGRSRDTVVIDVTGGGTPVVTNAGQLSSLRYWVDATLLPDGRVLATGGSVKDSTAYFYDPIETYGSNLTAEIWDPRTGEWTVGASAQVPRLYHSTALLLPDGRVLTAGGGSPGPITNTDAEIYSPDYLVQANGQPSPRLEILGLSAAAATAGQQLDLTVSAGADVQRVTLVKSGSVTHSFNMEQRFVELGFAVDGNTVTAQLPVNDAEITPGYYLLSVLDENDIPSVSELIKIDVPNATQLNTTVDGEVLRLYRAYFQRDPDPAGFVYWRRQRLAGVPLAAISDAFAGSAEFVNRYGVLANGDFVDRLYQNVLGRPADDAGRAYWMTQLAAGVGRGEIMLAFSESQEFMTRTGTAGLEDVPTLAPNPAPAPAPGPAPDPGPVDPVADHVAEIRRLYLGYFLRAADPDGLAYWTQARADGISLIEVSAEFARSAEFVARYGLADDATFVDLVYQNVLGRPADAEGRAYWIGQLGAGMTRGELMVGFTESPENVAATADRI
ncbi:MAG: DUF4214 domain-containing protein [Actinomycetota bacterium]